MVKEFNSLEEIQKYYDKSTNTYVFKENGECIDIKFNFDLSIDANIEAWNINAWNIDCLNINAWDITAIDIKACNIKAFDINAWNIDACNISYWALCFAYANIKCNSITSRRDNHKHFALDGKLEVEEDE